MKKKNLATAMAAAMAVSAVAPVVAQAAEVETLETLNQKRTTAIDTAKATINGVVGNIEKVGAEIKTGIGDNSLDTEADAITPALNKGTNIDLDGNVDYAKLTKAMTGLNAAKDAIETKSGKIITDLTNKKDANSQTALATIQAIKDGIVKAEKEVKAVKDLDDAIKAKEDEKLDADRKAAKESLKEAFRLNDIAMALQTTESKDALKGAFDQIKNETDTTIGGKDQGQVNTVKGNIDAVITAAKNLIETAKASAVDVAKANGLKVEVKEYKDVYVPGGTLDTKDAKLSLKDGEEIIYSEGTIEKQIPATNAKFAIQSKMTEKELKAAKDDIRTENDKLKTQKEKLEALLSKTYTKDGKTVKTYKIDEKASKELSGLTTDNKVAKVTVLVNEDSAVNGEEKVVTFVEKNVKVDSKLVNKNDEKENLGFTTVLNKVKEQDEKANEKVENRMFEGLDVKDNFELDFTTNPQDALKTYNKLFLALDKAYEGKKDIKVEESQKVDGNNIVKTITYKNGKDTLGTVTIKGFEIFNKEYANKVVRISEVKDLADLEGADINYAKAAVVDALYNGHLKGDENKNLNLKSDIKRAEFAKLLVELNGLELEKKVAGKDKKEFADVAKDAWYHDYVVTLQNAGVVTGDGNGKFRPEDTITRQEVAVMIARTIVGTKAGNKITGQDVDLYNKITGEAYDTETNFLDDENIAIWADASVKVLQTANVTNGYKVKNHFEFRPANNITRAEALVMINRAKKEVGNHTAEGDNLRKLIETGK